MSFDQTTTIIALVFSGGIAIGTISLAYFALRQIKQIRRDYKIGQSNDILLWAENVRNWAFTKEDRERLEKKQKTQDIWIESFLIITSHGNNIMNFMRTGYILTKVASGFKKPNLVEKIKAVITHLLTLHRILGELRGQIIFTATQTPSGFQNKLIELIKQQGIVNQAAKDVITEVGELIPNL